MKIVDAFASHKSYKKYHGLIGLEIETETVNPYDAPKFSFWSIHQDGSLRDFGVEYVLKQPVKFEGELDAALEEFQSKTKGIPFNQDSITTSVHVHMNMLNESFITLGNFLTAYTLVENLLIRYSGPDRRSNLFCLPVCDAEETYKNAVKMIKCAESRNYGGMFLSEEATKYAAMNLSALGQYGSLEFRSFRGTTDTGQIKTWISLLHSILEYARQPNLIPPNIVEGWRDKGPELLSEIFGEHRKLVRLPEEEGLIEKNFWYACAIAYSIKDWAVVDEEPKQKKIDPKQLDNLANMLYGTPFDNLSPAKKEYVMICVMKNTPIKKGKKNPYLLEDFVASQAAQAARPWNGGVLAIAQNEPVEEEFLNEDFEDEDDL